MKKLTIVTTAYRSGRYLQKYFEGILNLNNLDQLRVVLVMNVPEEEELRIAQGYSGRYPHLFQIIKVDFRETIGASLNRGFSRATTPYTSYLDVDDIRVGDSYDRQIAVLEHNPDVDFTYGDYIAVKSQGDTRGDYNFRPEFDPVEFTCHCHASPTQCWRTELLQKIGGWDEQFRSAGDFEFNIRAALNCKFKKTPGLLLYYTRYAGSGSASSIAWGPIEYTAIELRYGNYDVILRHKNWYRFVLQARRYRLEQILINGDWQPIERYVPNYWQIMAEREPIRRAFEVKWPIKTVQYYASLPGQVVYRNTRSGARWALEQLGVLERVRGFLQITARDLQ